MFPMGRTKNFSPEGVLEKALPVFWKYGFADTQPSGTARTVFT
jgi:hypothetical protein